MNIKPCRIILGISMLSLLTLSGCFNFGGGNTAPTDTSGNKTKVYETSDYSITIPNGWEIIEKKDFTSAVPQETQVVFRNNVKNENFTANVNIVKNGLQQAIPTTDYANMVLNREKTGLYDYKESRKDPSKISIGGTATDTFFVLFEAKKTAGDSVVRYLQTYGVKGDSAYIVTGAISTQENAAMATTIESVVKSFKLK